MAVDSDERLAKNTARDEFRNPYETLSFFQLDDPILEQIREDIQQLDINTLTPVEALMKLNEIKKITLKN